MDAKTRKALEASIKHWQENVAAETPMGASTSSDACALCKSFFDNYCEGCPVFDKTGKGECGDTPYKTAHDTLRYWQIENTERSKSAWRKAAQAELDFLISLRPE